MTKSTIHVSAVVHPLIAVLLIAFDKSEQGTHFDGTSWASQWHALEHPESIIFDQNASLSSYLFFIQSDLNCTFLLSIVVAVYITIAHYTFDVRLCLWINKNLNVEKWEQFVQCFFYLNFHFYWFARKSTHTFKSLCWVNIFFHITIQNEPE